MYLGMIVLLMVVLPAVSVVAELMVVPAHADLMALVGKWFVFWAVGVRLALAGLRQVADPSFTARTIFRIHDPQAGKIVQEIGFGNLAMGGLGLLSLPIPAWVTPAALAGGLYLGLAGGKHVLNSERTRTETIALVSDLWAFAVLAVFVLTRWL